MTSNNDQSKTTKSYREHATQYYNQKYETWMPWIEDQYLKWFTKDNKASYATKRMISFSYAPTLPLQIPQIFFLRRPRPPLSPSTH